MMPPFFSIVIPVFNTEKTVIRTLNSVYTQSSTDDGNYEIIVVNDGSTDSSHDIVENYAKGKKNIKVVSQKNKGLGGARNAGLTLAEGQVLLFLDSDDILLPTALASLQKRYNGEDILEFSASRIFEHKMQEVLQLEESTAVVNGMYYYLNAHGFNSACNKLYSRKFLVSNQIYFMERIFGEDFDFNTRTLLSAAKVSSTNIIAAGFYQTPNSITRNSTIEHSKKYIEDCYAIIENFEPKEVDQETSKIQKIFFDSRYTEKVVTILFQFLKCTHSQSSYNVFVGKINRYPFNICRAKLNKNQRAVLFLFQLSPSLFFLISRFFCLIRKKAPLFLHFIIFLITLSREV